MSDFRMKTDYFQHYKIRQLRRRLGADGVLSHLQLLAFVAENRPRGILTGMKAESIAVAANWTGSADAFLNTLLELKLIDRVKNGAYAVHDWKENNPWAWHKPERRKQAQKAANIKWSRRTKTYGYADSANQQCGMNADRNAPSPTPSPIPTPSPNPIPKNKSVGKNADPQIPDKKPPKKPSSEHQEVIAYWCERYDAVYQIPYKVSGARDGAAVKALLQRWKPKPGDNSHRAADNVIALINEYFEMREEFYVKDRTLARLRRFDNEIAQSLITRKGVTDIKDTF
jgi:hypothetical protein